MSEIDFDVSGTADRKINISKLVLPLPPTYDQANHGNLLFKDTGTYAQRENIYLVEVQDMIDHTKYNPILAIDQGLWVEKDIQTYGAVMSSSDPAKTSGGGAIMLGHGFQGTLDPPAIYLSDSGITNLVTYSELFINAVWTGYNGNKNNITNSDTQDFLSPDLQHNTAQRIDTSVSGGCTGCYQSVNPSLQVGQDYTVSIWLRGAVGGELIRIGLNDSYESANITLTTDWVRYSFTATPTSGSTSRGMQFRCLTANASYYAWGAQLQTGSVLRSYVTTTNGQNAPFDTLYLKGNGSPAHLDVGNLTVHGNLTSALATSGIVGKSFSWLPSDISGAEISLQQGTSTNGAFLPMLTMRPKTSGMWGLWMINTQSGEDSGSQAISEIRASINGGSVSTRPLLRVTNNGTNALAIGPTGNLSIYGSSTQLNPSGTGNTGLEIGNSSNNGGLPFIDFHFGVQTSQDYNVRLINESNGLLRCYGQFSITSTLTATNIVLTNTYSGITSSGLEVFLQPRATDGMVTIYNHATNRAPLRFFEASQCMTFDTNNIYLDGSGNLTIAGNLSHNGNWIQVGGGNVVTDKVDGLSWHGIPTGTNETGYGIFRTAGAWSGTYAQLKIRWDTGIIIDANAQSIAYGVRIQPNGGTTTFGGPISSAGNLTLGNYSTNMVLSLCSSNNSSAYIKFFDNNSTEGGYIKTIGKSGGATMYFGGIWDTETDRFSMDLTNGALWNAGAFTSGGVATFQQTGANAFNVYGEANFSDQVHLAGRIDFNMNSGKYGYFIWINDFCLNLSANSDAGCGTWTYGGNTYYYGALNLGAVFLNYLQELNSSQGILCGGTLKSNVNGIGYSSWNGGGGGGNNGGIALDAYGNACFQSGSASNSWHVFNLYGYDLFSIKNNPNGATYGNIDIHLNPYQDRTWALGSASLRWAGMCAWDIYFANSHDQWDSIDDLAYAKQFKGKTITDAKGKQRTIIDPDTLKIFQVDYDSSNPDHNNRDNVEEMHDLHKLVGFMLCAHKASAEKHDQQDAKIETLLREIEGLRSQLEKITVDGGVSA